MFRHILSCDLQYFTSCNELPGIWDDLLPDGHYLKREQLAISENAALPNVGYVYIMAMRNDKPIAAVSFQTLQLSREHLNNQAIHPYQSVLWSIFTTTLRPTLLVAGHLFRHDVASYYWGAGIGTYDAYALYKRSIDKALHHTCAMAVLVKDVSSELVDYFHHYAPQYFMLRNDISMEMEIPASWHTMNEYAHALKHKYTQRYKKIRQAWELLEVRELSANEVVEHKDRLYELYRQVAEKQQVRLGFLSPGYIVSLKRYYGEELKIWAVYENENIIAFFTAWVQDAALDMFYIGFNYEKNNTYQLYFNILFFAIEQAIALRKDKLILGRTALDAKARLGCKPNYLKTFLYIKNRMVRNRVLQMQQRASANEGEWEQRHPFKQSGDSTI